MLESRRRSRSSRWPRVVLLVVVALLVGGFAGGHSGWMPGWLRSAFTNQSAQDRQTQSILGLIEKDYYRPVDAQSLANHGLVAAVQSLDDPYSHYYPPEKLQPFRQETNPQVSGIGISVSANAKGLYVDLVFPGGPAAKAKVTQGEIIVAVNGTSLKGLSLARASDLVKGRTGTRVSLTLLSNGKPHTVTVVRREVVEPVAFSKLIKYHGTKLGYVEFAQFTQNSAAQLRIQVKRMLAAGAQGLILDLRDNPGGLVAQAIGVASIFIPSGTIVTTRGRNQPTTVYTALGGKALLAPSIPLAVLVNRDTASSAEIVTAALQQRRHAQVIGTRTYGKGVFQESQTVAGGGILDITVGEFFTPNGTNLGGSGVAQGRDLTRGPGIKPNVYVPDNPTAPGPAALHTAESVLAGEL